VLGSSVCDPSTYTCQSSGEGMRFSPESLCDKYCEEPPPRYTCDTENWQCVENPNGVYASLKTCQSDCTNKCICKRCSSAGSCIKQCSTNADCNTVLPPEEDIYACTDPFALNYNPEATIDDGSCEYECKISNFDVPDMMWVGYPRTAEWSTNEVCETGQITCRLKDGADCGDREDLSSDDITVGYDQTQPFTIKQAGYYQYELEACGPNNCDVWGDGSGAGEPKELPIIRAINLPIWWEINPVLPKDAE